MRAEGDVLSFYLQPEAQVNEEYGALRLASGYVKLTLLNVEPKRHETSPPARFRA